jgi:hypothetical protein
VHSLRFNKSIDIGEFAVDLCVGRFEKTR